MKGNKLLILTMGLALSGWSVAGTVNKPEVSATYQNSFQAAWDKTAEGELPIYECGQLVGTATKMLSKESTAKLEAQQAYKACYVDAILNYSDAFFKTHNRTLITDDNKPFGCPSYLGYLAGHISSLEVYAERFGLSVNDLNQEISERLAEPATLCEIALN